MKLDAPATIKGVAKLAGASLSTVSYVLNDESDKFVSEELRLRVLEAAKKLNYRPNQIARRLRGKIGKILAVLVPQFDNIYFNRVVIGAQRVADEQGYILCIYSTYDDERRELAFVQNILSQQIDGILLCPANNQTASVDLIRESNIPFTIIDRGIPGSDFDFVEIDNYQAAYHGTEYLIQKGHTKITYCGWETEIDAVAERKEGFLAAIKKHKLPLDQIIIWECSRYQEEAYEEGVNLVAHADASAVFLGQNQVAEGFIRAMNRLTALQNRDLSVVLFGDPPWATITSPEYTCISQPDIEMGELATKMLIARIEQPQKSTEHIVLQAELVERDSVFMLGK
jgi:LacI family transcriptional regulator